MHIETFTPRQFRQLEPLWQELADGPDMTAFQSVEWNAITNRQVSLERLARLGTKCRYLVVVDGERPVLIAPLRFQRLSWSHSNRSGCHFMARSTSTDYLDFIYREFSSEALAMVLSHAATRYGARFFRFERILAHSASTAWLASLPGAVVTKEKAVALSVPDSRERYQALLTKRFRQNLRTANNRARSDGVELRVEIGGRLPRSISDQLRLMKHRRNRSRRGPAVGARFRDVVQQIYRHAFFGAPDTAFALIHENDRAWTMLVRDQNNHICAFAAGMFDRRSSQKSLRVMLVSFDETFARYSPGVAGLSQVITEAIDTWEKPSLIDFTRGLEKYKFDLGGVEHDYIEVALSLGREGARPWLDDDGAARTNDHVGG